jgi:hypothetical protein
MKPGGTVERSLFEPRDGSDPVLLEPKIETQLAQAIKGAAAGAVTQTSLPSRQSGSEGVAEAVVFRSAAGVIDRAWVKECLVPH